MIELRGFIDFVHVIFLDFVVWIRFFLLLHVFDKLLDEFIFFLVLPFVIFVVLGSLLILLLFFFLGNGDSLYLCSKFIFLLDSINVVEERVNDGLLYLFLNI